MIKIDGYNLIYNTAHMLSEKPKTYEAVIQRLDTMECKLFYNIVSSPNCRYEKKFADGRINESYKNLNAEERFQNIFTKKIIYANPKGYFVNKLNILPRVCNEIKSVSFTLCDYTELPKHFEARGSEFGICFFHDFLQNKGLRPVEYLGKNPNKDKSLTFNSPHLIEVCSEKYDMSWENEWRINYDMEFSQDDIAFVIVPQDKHPYYINWFLENTEFKDITILSANTFKSSVEHLISYPQQGDTKWGQIKIFATENLKGLTINPEDFNDLSTNFKKELSEKFKKELNCFAKCTIQLSYETAFTNRFIKFRDKIQKNANIGKLFEDYPIIKANMNEPWDAHRDILIKLFGDIYTLKYYNIK